MLTHAQILGYINIMVNFQLRSSINAGLTERSLCNRFCIRYPKMVFLGGFLGQGLRYLVGTPLGMQWPPIYGVWWKHCGTMRHYNTISWSCRFVYCCDQWFVYEWCLVFASSWIFTETPEFCSNGPCAPRTPPSEKSLTHPIPQYLPIPI